MITYILTLAPGITSTIDEGKCAVWLSAEFRRNSLKLTHFKILGDTIELAYDSSTRIEPNHADIEQMFYKYFL